MRCCTRRSIWFQCATNARRKIAQYLQPEKIARNQVLHPNWADFAYRAVGAYQARTALSM